MLNTFESSLVQWGNALVIRIPETIAESAHLTRDERVICTVENGNVVIKPTRQRYTLEALLEGTTEIEAELDWGKPMGAEIW
jgi:antitoxin component of MazEF toxin-antitoxin module